MNLQDALVWSEHPNADAAHQVLAREIARLRALTLYDEGMVVTQGALNALKYQRDTAWAALESTRNDLARVIAERDTACADLARVTAERDQARAEVVQLRVDNTSHLDYLKNVADVLSETERERDVERNRNDE